AVAAGYGRVPVDAVGPTGEVVATSYAARDSDAVVELADVVGLGRLPDGRLAPMSASTYGLGLVIADAIERGATRVVIGVGGSASPDGGAGMVEALGAVIHGDDMRGLPRGGANLADVTSLDLSSLRQRVAGVSFTVASDVDNPLLGARGAAAVFGPQKG